MLLQFDLRYGDKVAIRTEEIVLVELSGNIVQVAYRNTQDCVSYSFDNEHLAQLAYTEICDAIKEEYQDNAN